MVNHGYVTLYSVIKRINNKAPSSFLESSPFVILSLDSNFFYLYDQPKRIFTSIDVRKVGIKVFIVFF